MSEMFVWQQKEEFTEALSHSLGDKLLRILYVFFFCNRGDTYYSIITAGFRQGSLAKPLSLLFLTPRPALPSHQHPPGFESLSTSLSEVKSSCCLDCQIGKFYTIKTQKSLSLMNVYRNYLRKSRL